ncbi:GTPase HflX [Serpentinicella alkaliphila]|uniref:GTPase HflX n=1 Tax=Serpentinicella alkaliphila TaxID=1734049 RepID=A0A4R2TF77_9FIRM|nr:GTPase HflX [Serpentinicella alkaliphila]QUH26021.1 GTPase HflX [Serpentinicella alkaliphila]TCP99714.1 GTP-binding protein HflX [Serpentinicella alkaliphila]
METNEIMEKEVQRAVLVGFNNTSKIENIEIESSMDELEELAKTAGAEVLARIIQNKASIDAKYYIGKGKVEEIKQFSLDNDANVVIFNDELSGSQIRNLEEAIGIDVIDRTALILDIFAQRAQSKEGKLQVELAQLKYRLPRLTGLGNQLSRLGSGIGTRGPGEKKLETDRRHILRRIDDIKEQLDDVKKNRETQRSQRIKSELPIVALVGYTNAGKSTLMNSLLNMSVSNDEKKYVYAEDKLFATLDVSLRKISLEDKFEFLLTDTVGFVSKLPHGLVNAFKATLEEVKYADLLLHIIDASNSDYKLQKETTKTVLKELGINDKKIVDVYNKIDKMEDIISLNLDEKSLCVSAKNGTNLDKLLELVRTELGVETIKTNLTIPYDKGNVLSQLHKDAIVISTEYAEQGIVCEVQIDKDIHYKYKEFEKK